MSTLVLVVGSTTGQNLTTPTRTRTDGPASGPSRPARSTTTPKRRRRMRVTTPRAVIAARTRSSGRPTKPSGLRNHAVIAASFRSCSELSRARSGLTYEARSKYTGSTTTKPRRATVMRSTLVSRSGTGTRRSWDPAPADTQWAMHALSCSSKGRTGADGRSGCLKGVGGSSSLSHVFLGLACGSAQQKHSRCGSTTAKTGATNTPHNRSTNTLVAVGVAAVDADGEQAGAEERQEAARPGARPQASCRSTVVLLLGWSVGVERSSSQPQSL